MNTLHRTGRLAVVLLAFIVTVASIFVVTPVGALDPSLWVNSQEPTYEHTETTDVPTQPDNEPCIQTDFTVIKNVGGLPVDQQISDCVVTTNFGAISKSFLKLGWSTKALKLEAPGTPILVPHSDYVVLSAPSGFAGNYLRIFKRPIAQFTQQPSTSVWKTAYKTQAQPDWVATDNNGQALLVDAIAPSANGEWLVFRTGTKLMRLSMKTLQFMTFAEELPTYSAIPKPTVHLTISDDGRYVALGGANVTGLRIFDLSTCAAPVIMNSRDVVSGCGKRDLTALMQSKVPQYRDSRYFEFSSKSADLELHNTAAEGTKLYKATLTSPLYVAKQLDYLAMGDSFSSGEGEDKDYYYVAGTNRDAEPETGVDTSKEICHLSTRSYPFLLADSIGIDDSKFTNVSCSGGQTADVIDLRNDFLGHFEQLYDDNLRADIKTNAIKRLFPGRAPQISFVTTYKPKAITLTMGGNDIGFGNKLEACVMPGSSCAYATSDEERSKFGSEINNQFDPLVDLYKRIKNESGASKIYVVGYPQFLTDPFASTVCHNSQNVHFDLTERQFIYRSVAYFNDVIQAAANHAGVTYVDIENSLLGRTLCSEDAAGIAFNGLRGGEEHVLRTIGNESYHPNPIGHRLMAETIATKVGNLLTYTCTAECPHADSAPAVPEYFSHGTTVFNAPINTPLTNSQPQKGENMNLFIELHNLKPGSTANVELHSAPISLGTLTPDENGTIGATVQVPSNIPAGEHTLHVFTTTPSGESIDLYQHLFVAGPQGDIDEDTVPDAQDPCLFVPPAGADTDQDGQDDACDAHISEPPQDTTPPLLLEPTWTNNPKPNTGTATLQVATSDDSSAITQAEYYLGDTDPGPGNGATMQISNQIISTSFGTDFPTGVYKVTVRAKDTAGNWSADLSEFLVVYNPAGTRMTGKRVLVPTLANGDILPGLTTNDQTDKATFGFNVRYDKNGLLHAHSDFQFAYTTGTKCNNPLKATNCNSLEFNAQHINWLATQGPQNSTGIFEGTGNLAVNGAVSTVRFRVVGLDGERINLASQDHFTLKLYNLADNPNTTPPLYQISGQVARGNIKIRIE